MEKEEESQMELVNKQSICVEGKHEGHFFENVLTEIVEKGYLKEEDIQRIQVELITLWKEQIEAYNRGKSSSITEKKAKRLLESIYHTLGFRLRALNHLDESIDLLQYSGIKALFEEGQNLIEERFKVLKKQYEKLMNRLLPIDNIAYRDTYDEGLAPFFKFYSPKFESQECPGDIDYPLSNDRMELEGIEYMVDYIEKSLLEHELCWKFKIDEIKALLQGYHKGYKELNINIFEMILMNAIGRLIVDKSLERLELEEEDVERIEKELEILPTALLEKKLIEKGMEVLDSLSLTSLEMKNYTIQTIKKYVPRIELILEDETLNKVFVVTQYDERSIIHYQGGHKLSNEAFKTLIEKIRDCQEVEDKIRLIKAEVQHVEDLKDVLEADCLWEQEYGVLYESLEDTEIALLINLLRVDDHDILQMDVDKEWFKYLRQYLESLSLSRQEAISTIEKSIWQN